MDMIRGEKDLNTQSSSWVPQTPVKPNLVTSQPICGAMEGNQVGYGYNPTNSVDMNKGFPNWDASGGLAVGNMFSMDSEGLKSLPFGDLMALADSAAAWRNGSAHSHGAGPSNPVIPIFDSQFGTSWNMGRAGGDMFCRPDAWINSSCAPAAASYGNAVPFQYDLSSPTGALLDLDFSRNISSQFAPVTPNQSKKMENYQANGIHTNLNQISGQKRVEVGNEVSSTTNQVDLLLLDEEQQQVQNLSTTAVSTGLHEDQNPDIDLNKTPQQKPRRRKHRPKVVVEGQAKKMRKPATPKTPAPKENPTGKRKYVRKNPLNKTPNKPVSEVASGSSDPKATQEPTRSCKRSLNFDLECQVQEEISVCGTQYRNNAEPPLENRVRSKSVVQLGQGIETLVEKTQVGIAHDLTRAMNNVLQDYLSMPQAQAPSPSIPKKTQLEPGVLKPYGQSEMYNKEGVPNGHSQLIPRSPNYSNCSSSSASLIVEQAKRLKRGPSCVTEPSRTNVIGGYFNSLSRYMEIFPESAFNNTEISSMHFPTVQKEKRTQEKRNATTSSILNIETPAVDSAPRCPPSNACVDVTMPESICGAPALQLNIGSIQTVGEQGMDRQRTLASNVAPETEKMMSKKKSKHCSTSPVGPCTKYGAMQVYKISSQPQASMEGMVKEPRRKMPAKRRMKKNSSSIHTDAMQKKIPSVDEIAEYLKHLDINRESNGVTFQDLRAVVPYNVRYGEQNALVLYQKDGTMVPFEGPFDPIRKRKPRPKVDLDDETTRVWKLLLENINNDGIDGTDEDKAKWWEEERRVFRGRADSFIARMHLVQGDRRFSPWKGSVVDSVVGVFLTQNVSDHLSSSAFMSLAARFPLNENPRFDEPEVIIEEPEECPEQLDYQRTSVVLHEGDCGIEKEAGDSNEILGSSCDGVRSTGNSKCQSPDTSEICQRSTEGKEKVQLTESVETFVGEKVTDDVFSSQDSSVSFVDSSVAQSTDLNSVPSSSFVELLRAETLRGLRNCQTENVSSYDEASECNGKSQDKDALEKSTTSLRPMMPPSICGLQTTGHSEVLGPGSFDLFAEEIRSSDKSKKIQQYCPSEQSEVTAESVGQAALIESTSLIGNLKNAEHTAAESSLKEINGASSDISKPKSSKTGKKKENLFDWDSLRVQAQAKGKREKTASTLDSLDWDAVRCADVSQIADAIKERGMNNMLAERIKAFLNRLVEEHEGIDLEWLRDVPPDKAKEYLLSIRGLGLKSVECVRLLTLHHLAFPVDTNVGRIAVRLGWVPLQPLPESLQLHLLELYPVMESIQKYLWPRLCKLDQRTLYELHYQMITFGKVFCTKSKPNCNACPMRGECRHFASAFASARLALPGPVEKSIVTTSNDKATDHQNRTNPHQLPLPLPLPQPLGTEQLQPQHRNSSNLGLIVEVPVTPAPTIELPATPVPTIEVPATSGPIIEVPASPEPAELQVLETDIEDAFAEDPDEIPLIKLNIEELTQNLQNYMQHNMELQEGDMNKALVALTPEAASIPMPKLKNVSRLRTEHQVYELPDSHPLLEGLERRDRDDPCSYLLAIWTPGETPTSIQPPEQSCSRSQESGELCENSTCFSCNSIREANSQIVRGTLLIPCRTAMRGSFPLNGTYFQVNEVFADHASSIRPIEVPRAWIWNLPRRTVYFGTSVTSIFKGLSTESIQYCFWRGFVCVRGFDLQSRAPRPLLARLHFPASRLKETKAKASDQKQE